MKWTSSAQDAPNGKHFLPVGDSAGALHIAPQSLHESKSLVCKYLRHNNKSSLELATRSLPFG